MTQTTPLIPKLALGPVLFYWSRDDVLDFYRQVQEWPLEIVYLGETVCSKRRSLRTDDWLELANQLQAAGKEVVLSTLCLIEAESELKTLRRLCGNGRFLVEANDLGAVQLLIEEGVPFVTGPTVNLYNPHSLALLARQGLKRWVPPVELSQPSLRDTLAALPADLETEIFAFGRLPLALSARCFTARSHNLPKDDCQFRCLDDPDGRLVRTQEQQPFVTLNGIQTLSALTCNLLPELEALRGLGIDVLRISPQSRHTGSIVQAFANALQAEPQATATNPAQWAPLGYCNGYWHGHPGLEFAPK